MNPNRSKRGYLIATYRTLGSPKSRHAGNWRELAERTTTCIEGHVSYVDQIAIQVLLFIIQRCRPRSENHVKA